MVPESLSVARVVDRVVQGGHDVSEQKIRERYIRLWPLVMAARDIAGWQPSTTTAAHQDRFAWSPPSIAVASVNLLGRR
jgi:hypothetical protein